VAQPVFYFDLADPECYLATEQMIASGRIAEFEPVAAAELGIESADADHEAIERRALELGIQPVRWPEYWPPDSSKAMLAAAYAKQIGRVVAFSLAAFRQTFAAGRDLGSEETILLAGAACEMHPSALLKGLTLRSTAQALDRAVERARADGVTELPAVVETTGPIA
jgi:2-hydroxychromene-2-carboxylate isomerase